MPNALLVMSNSYLSCYNGKIAWHTRHKRDAANTLRHPRQNGSLYKASSAGLALRVPRSEPRLTAPVVTTMVLGVYRQNLLHTVQQDRTRRKRVL
eukprot:scaffold325_cov230-Pinguiococcus_pyrenoidosus.AAC.10